MITDFFTLFTHFFTVIEHPVINDEIVNENLEAPIEGGDERYKRRDEPPVEPLRGGIIGEPLVEKINGKMPGNVGEPIPSWLRGALRVNLAQRRRMLEMRANERQHELYVPNTEHPAPMIQLINGTYENFQHAPVAQLDAKAERSAEFEDHNRYATSEIEHMMSQESNSSCKELFIRAQELLARHILHLSPTNYETFMYNFRMEVLKSVNCCCNQHQCQCKGE
jgi:hypothetical protein